MLRLAILTLICLALTTACSTVKEIVPVDPGEGYREAVIALMPEAPVLPEFPTLNWTYQDGLYCINEADVDKLLDYRDNALPLYRYEAEVYEEQIKAIIKGIEGDMPP